MCQAYETEARFVTWSEQNARNNGRPDQCEFQAGYLTCYSTRLPEVYSHKTDEGWGWRCESCGTFYRSKDQRGCVR